MINLYECYRWRDCPENYNKKAFCINCQVYEIRQKIKNLKKNIKKRNAKIKKLIADYEMENKEKNQ